MLSAAGSACAAESRGARPQWGPGRKGSGAGGGGEGKGVQAPSTDLQGLWGAARHPSHEGYLLLQVVEPAAQLGLAGAEHEKWGGQRACGGGTEWARPGAHRRGPSRVGRSH